MFFFPDYNKLNYISITEKIVENLKYFKLNNTSLITPLFKKEITREIRIYFELDTNEDTKDTACLYSVKSPLLKSYNITGVCYKIPQVSVHSSKLLH